MRSTEFTTANLDQLPALQPADWGDLRPRFQYFIDSEYCKPVKIAENGVVVAVGTVMLHEDTAWIACIVVHPDHRKKGLGNYITSDIIADIDRDHFKTIYLDATDFGYPVYLKLGFKLENQYAHLRRNDEPFFYESSEHIVPFEEKWHAQVLALDKLVSGEDRGGILNDFLSASKLYIRNEQVEGFFIPDWGDGPVVATNNEAGLELMKLRIQHYDYAVLPTENQAAIDFLKENNFEIRKHSRRMLLGPERSWKPELLFNRISGQLG
jgi:N-acetylglutamate synthase-like GNAT family acetyltransferase